MRDRRRQTVVIGTGGGEHTAAATWLRKLVVSSVTFHPDGDRPENTEAMEALTSSSSTTLGSPAGPTPTSSGSASGPGRRQLGGHLSGGQEVPARDTQARGVATVMRLGCLAAVLAAMASGDTYVNVHTNDGMPPVDSGPGDFPGGEIRGQVHQHSPTRQRRLLAR